MSGPSLNNARRIVGLSVVLAVAITVVWFFGPGLPVLWAPYASAETREAGKALFVHEWKPNDELASGDGLGPVFNARSCVACHFQGGIGGGGTNEFNVRVFETFEVNPAKPETGFRAGVIHTGAVDAAHRESEPLVRQLFPIIPGTTRNVGGCLITVPQFDPLHEESINTTALYGAGWIDRISTKTILHNHNRKMWETMVKEFQLDFSSIPQGRPNVLPDGRVGRFGWKAQFATLKEFVAAACANELGLGTPTTPQAKTLARCSCEQPDVKPDLNSKQFGQLVAYVDTLPRPTEVKPSDSVGQERAARGKHLFGCVGCAVCHTPDLGGVEGVYSDFLLHDIGKHVPPGGSGGYNPPVQRPDAVRPSHIPAAREWKTPPLWGVADSAPYFHDGGAPTLRDAILRHSGDADTVTKAFQALSADDQRALIDFLKTLKAPTDADPVVASR